MAGLIEAGQLLLELVAAERGQTVVVRSPAGLIGKTVDMSQCSWCGQVIDKVRKLRSFFDYPMSLSLQLIAVNY